METAEKRISKTKVLILYSIAFYTIWTLFEFLGKPVIVFAIIRSSIGNNKVLRKKPGREQA